MSIASRSTPQKGRWDGAGAIQAEGTGGDLAGTHVLLWFVAAGGRKIKELERADEITRFSRRTPLQNDRVKWTEGGGRKGVCVCVK